MSNLPIDGKGFFIWQIDGDPPYTRYLDLLKVGSYQHVVIKIADGTERYNISSSGVDKAKHLTDLLRDNDIAVWGYQYVYGDYPTGEADIAVSRCTYLQVDGFVIDAEGEYKEPGKKDNAETYMSRLRLKAPTLPVALCSYRWPSVHPEFPWREFLDKCDLHMPQVYWLLSTNPAFQLERSYNELMELKVMPFIPVGCAFKHKTWQPTPEQEIQFMDKAQSMGMPAVNFWEMNYALRNLPAIYATISDYEYPYDDSVPSHSPSPSQEIPPIEEDIDMDYEKIDAFLLKYPTAQVVLNVNGGSLEDDGGDVPPAPPAGTFEVVITDDPKANMRWAPENNESGYPIFVIYPSDSSTTSQRVQVANGTKLRVYAQKRGDSGKYCYPIYNWQAMRDNGGKAPTGPLYARVEDADPV